MNEPNQEHSGNPPDQQEFLEWVMRYQDGTLSPTEVQQLTDLLRADAARREQFLRIQMRTATLHDLFRMDAFTRAGSLLDDKAAFPSSEPTAEAQPWRSIFRRVFSHAPSVWTRRHTALGMTGMAALALLLVCGSFFWNRVEAPKEGVHADASVVEERSVLLVEENRATFFGARVLAAGQGVPLYQDYLLQSGMVKLLFPSGATAIIEAPSIFRVENEDRLVLNTGGCSVHAPAGAEGFEVLTPLTKVVDRGTRFYVKVQDTSETEVHVIEGAADLYTVNHGEDETDSTPQEIRPVSDPLAIRLVDGEAVQLGGFVDDFGERTLFNPARYRGQLPDRLVSYEATTSANGMADELKSLTVQRQGRILTYAVEDLVPIEVLAFGGSSEPESNGYLCGFRKRPSRPEDWLEDRHLATGLINFGGQKTPLKKLPLREEGVLDVAQAPPGLGIRFRRPVINHPGPDLVLFEIQSFVNLAEGDPFHVYPVSHREDLRPFTVTKYDLTLNSSGVRQVAPLWSHRFSEAIQTLDELRDRDAPVIVDVGHMHFHVIGVGIDLSDLGYAEGESVTELFLQHASSDLNVKVDPVFIAGLPPLNPEELPKPNPAVSH